MRVAALIVVLFDALVGGIEAHDFAPAHCMDEAQPRSQRISKAHLDHLYNNANPNLQRNVGHSIYQWDAVFSNGTLFKGGWAGQGLLINPRWDVVAVYTGFFKVDAAPRWC